METNVRRADWYLSIVVYGIRVQIFQISMVPHVVMMGIHHFHFELLSSLLSSKFQIQTQTETKDHQKKMKLEGVMLSS